MMKVFLALFLVALLAVMLEGSLATIAPPPWSPDLGLLSVISVGLRWRGMAMGLVFAYMLGSSVDALSGSLMGLNALLYLFVFMSAIFAGRQLNLKGAFPVMAFAASVSFLYGFGLYLISTFFINGIEFSLRWFIESFLHALVNGVVAPLIVGIFSRVAVWAGADDSSERSLYIDTPVRPA